MSIASVNNHLSHYVTEIPANKALQLRSQAFWHNVAAKVAAVAIVVITAVILLLSTFAAKTGLLPIALLGLALTTPLLEWARSLASNKSTAFTNKANIEQGVAEKFKEIRLWGDSEIITFFDTHRLSIGVTQAILDERPLSKLLPLIARFQYWETVAQQQEQIVNTHRDLYQARHSNNTPEAHAAGQIALLTQETQVLPAKLRAAVLLQLIMYPNQELELETIGRIEEISTRATENLLSLGNPYFAFHMPTRPGIDAHTIQAPLARPSDLRPLLFPQHPVLLDSKDSKRHDSPV